MITGIYRITNIKNNKTYIGLSKDIERRWKNHTSNIQSNSSETIIRRAFAKYGLRQQVSKSGKYGNFLFEVIEECSEKQLQKRELFHIKQEQPAYNIQTMPPNSELYLKNISNNENKSFFQYHNFDRQNNFPGISELEDEDNDTILSFYHENENIEDAGHFISTKKALAGTIKGAIIYLILGITIQINKSYYLWSTTLVEELEFFKDEDLSYNVIGNQNFILPVLLNDESGFDAFKKSLGNFAFGLSSIEDSDFLPTLKHIASKHTATTMTQRDFMMRYLNLWNIKLI